MVDWSTEYNYYNRQQTVTRNLVIPDDILFTDSVTCAKYPNSNNIVVFNRGKL